MRSYLERLAAAAIAPGGSFHPHGGSLYAPTADPSPLASPMLEAEPQRDHQPASPANAGVQAPRFEQSSTPRAHEQSPPFQVSTSATVPPLPFPATLPSPLQPLASRAPAQPGTPALRSPEVDSRDGYSPHGEPSTGAEDARPFAAVPQRTRARTTSPQIPNAMAETQDATQPMHRDHVAESAPSFADSAHAANPRSIARNGQQAQESRVKVEDGSALPFTASVQHGEARPSPPRQSAPSPEPATTRTPAHEPAALTAPEPRAYQPLVADYTPPSSPPAMALQPGPHSPAARGIRERSREPEAREPDEIQIHIGRIEVTAFQPAPAALPQPAPRKTPSLDDYLRRGNGRA